MLLPTNLPSTALTLTTAPALVKGWSLGQLLQATVIGRIAQDSIAIEIGGRRLHAQVTGDFKPGQTLSLRVATLGEHPTLERVQSAPLPDAEAPPQTLALRQALPRQGPVGPLLANLAVLSEPGPLAERASAPLLAAARALVASLPSAETIARPGGMQEAVERSGLFLESSLASSPEEMLPQVATRDLKASLLRVFNAAAGEQSQPTAAGARQAAGADAAPRMTLSNGADIPPPLRQAPAAPQPAPLPSLYPEMSAGELRTVLAQQAEAALARIQVAQLSAIPTGPDAPATWIMDIPIRDREGVNVLQLRIEEDERQKSDSPAQDHRSYAVTLAINLGQLGPLYARVALSGDRVSASLWAENTETVRLIENNVHLLRDRFIEAGLECAEVGCYEGHPPRPRGTDSEPLVNVRV